MAAIIHVLFICLSALIFTQIHAAGHFYSNDVPVSSTVVPISCKKFLGPSDPELLESCIKKSDHADANCLPEIMASMYEPEAGTPIGPTCCDVILQFDKDCEQIAFGHTPYYFSLLKQYCQLVSKTSSCQNLPPPNNPKSPPPPPPTVSPSIIPIPPPSETIPPPSISPVAPPSESIPPPSTLPSIIPVAPPSESIPPLSTLPLISPVAPPSESIPPPSTLPSISPVAPPSESIPPPSMPPSISPVAPPSERIHPPSPPSISPVTSSPPSESNPSPSPPNTSTIPPPSPLSPPKSPKPSPHPPPSTSIPPTTTTPPPPLPSASNRTSFPFAFPPNLQLPQVQGSGDGCWEGAGETGTCWYPNKFDVSRACCYINLKKGHDCNTGKFWTDEQRTCCSWYNDGSDSRCFKMN